MLPSFGEEGIGDQKQEHVPEPRAGGPKPVPPPKVLLKNAADRMPGRIKRNMAIPDTPCGVVSEYQLGTVTGKSIGIYPNTVLFAIR
ncbi:hypothetical protein GSbR_40790 [Geobacter sp. SVR]|nr:hypothetical protein GSVR_26600 [Geobacter sp. SVR]GCF87479.1 hypothetical protein GSbR_40790 [Geobacter sp. SVR]